MAATLAAIAVLTVSENDARAEPAASSNSAEASAPEAPSITLVLPKGTVVETLVRVAELGNVDAMNLLGVLYTTGTEVPGDTQGPPSHVPKNSRRSAAGQHRTLRPST
jgi:hypothetical protein